MSDPVSGEAASVPQAADAAAIFWRSIEARPAARSRSPEGARRCGAGARRGRRGGDRDRSLWWLGQTTGGGVADNATATSLATVTRQSLSPQTQVSGTLGYAGSSSIRVPSGTAPSAVSQAQQSVTNAEGMLSSGKSVAGGRQRSARGSPGDARGGAREGAGRLRGRRRRGKRIRWLSLSENAPGAAGARVRATCRRSRAPSRAPRQPR